MQIREHTSGQGAVDKPAIILHPSGTVITFDELEARANRLAHYFRQAGLVEGDAVAILMENNEHIHAVMWAARRAGLYYVPINTHLTASEAAYIIDNSAAKAIIGSAALRKTCENLAEYLPDGLPALLMVAGPDVSDLEGWARYPECVAEQPDTPIDDEVEGDLLQYSSTIGPHQSIICFLISTGHGAAACITRSRLDRSYEVRMDSGSFSIRVNMTGTNCPCVTRWRWMASRQPSGSNFSNTTVVMPPACTVIDHTDGAV